MKVLSQAQIALPKTLTASAQAPSPASPPPVQDQAEIGAHKAGFSTYLSGAGGAVAGLGAGAASGAAALFVSHQLGRVLDATLPALDVLTPGAATVLATGAKIAFYSSAAAAAAGGLVGAQVAFGAAQGATKPDVTESATAGRHRQNAAELREHLAGVGKAESFGQAAAAGFRAGASIGGPAGALAGKIQGAVLGAALGGAAAVPLLGLIAHPAVLIPGALAGALLGAKIGEPLGHAAGSAALGGLGAAGAAVYHAF